MKNNVAISQVTTYVSLYQFQVGPSGVAVGIEHVPELVNNSLENIRKDSALVQLLVDNRIKIVTGDGRLGKHRKRSFVNNMMNLS